MVSLYGCANSFKFERYASKNPEMNIAIDYIAGWYHKEHRGDNNSYVGVVFYENRKGNVPKALIGLTIKKSSKVKVQYHTLEEFADNLLSKRLKFKEARVLSKTKVQLSGVEAISIELTYKSVDQLYVVEPKLISMQERVILFKRNDKFYTLRYENTTQEFSKFAKAFTRISASIKFND
jgi:hypothetical protein